VEEKMIIQGCLKNDRKAQKMLYEQYAPVLYAVIRRYIRDEFTAEDILIESFVKIYSKIKQYQGKGSFEGWMKRIAINEALMHLRKNNVFHLTIESDNIVYLMKPRIEEKIDFKILLQTLESATCWLSEPYSTCMF
jgi:RNA polymerase sigma factor (sigma-70 family)